MNKIRVYEMVAVEKEIYYCEECPACRGGAYSPSSGWCGCVCAFHQRELETGTEHIPVPDWCKIDEVKYPLRF